jgi:dihydroxy-acid dehydratase
MGGSTNFVIHLLAIAGRIGVALDINDFDMLSANIPLIANLQPSGEFFMEDFYYAGGLPAVMKEIMDHLHQTCKTVTGKTVVENISKAEIWNRNVIATTEKPFNQQSGIIVLKGNLCENGAIMKPSAASVHLMQHTGKAVVFENIEDYKKKIDEPDLDIDEDSIMVLKNVGPKSYPGMPEVGNMGLPQKLLEKGITDMVRISDGRMSGTGFGTVILHVSPEAADGGTLALVKDGDMIKLDVMNRSLQLLVPDEELEERRKQVKSSSNEFKRGYVQLYIEHVEQAHLGADFDFLKGGSGSEVLRDSH